MGNDRAGFAANETAASVTSVFRRGAPAGAAARLLHQAKLNRVPIAKTEASLTLA
jgi:hypothetical protein